MTGYKVFSAFDGSACGRVALERVGCKIDRYVASEIDKYAMTVAANNFLDIEHVGDITKVDGNLYKGFDLLVGGSPCQGFSFAGKQLNFEDPRSKLFFEFVRLKNEIQPKYFFLENVVMKKEFQDVISSYLGVQPIMLNSSLVSAQSRKRLYWTNIPGYTPPEDKGILLKDIVHENIDLDASAINSDGKAHCLTARYAGAQVKNSFEKRQRTVLFETLSEYIVPFDKTLQILDKEVARGKVGYFRKDTSSNRVYYIHDKAVTLCGDAEVYSNVFRDKSQTLLATMYKENPKSMVKRNKTGYLVFEPTGIADENFKYLFGEVKAAGIHQAVEGEFRDGRMWQPRQTDRVYNIEAKSPTLTLEAGRINAAIPCDPDYLFGCITPDRVDKRQNGQRFNDGTKFYTLTAQDRHGILVEGYIRKLTPIECERLQTLPDNYTLGVSNSQRYKMLGNGWTVDAVCEFFKHIPKDLDLF